MDRPAGNPVQTYDFQEPYLRCIFGLMGITDIRPIVVQGTLMNKPEQIEADTLKAIEEARKAAVAFA
jgi:FMN-dependent NADH-azoreductase